MSPPRFLLHEEGDSVAVAVSDIPAGAAQGAVLTSGRRCEVHVTGSIPLGHKLAVVPLRAGEDVIEYGVRVAITTRDIGVGDYVHVDNVRSARWQNSVA